MVNSSNNLNHANLSSGNIYHQVSASASASAVSDQDAQTSVQETYLNPNSPSNSTTISDRHPPPSSQSHPTIPMNRPIHSNVASLQQHSSTPSLTSTATANSGNVNSAHRNYNNQYHQHQDPYQYQFPPNRRIHVSSRLQKESAESQQALLRASAAKKVSVASSNVVGNTNNNNNHHNSSFSSFPATSTAASATAATRPSRFVSSSSGASLPSLSSNQYLSTSKSHDEYDKPKGTEGEWKIVEINNDTNNPSTTTSSSPPPCERSLHAATLWNDQLLIFGGYDGQVRRNDFYSFHLIKKQWNLIIGNGTIPSPRDRHCAIAHNNSFYIFGGFDGTSRVNDFYEFDFTTLSWKRILPNLNTGTGIQIAASASPPTPRHSHSAVVYQDSLYVFGGYDGSYRSDFHEYNFLTNTWVSIPPLGRSPRARYRATCVTYKNKMILYGGHDGTRHLSDLHLFDFNNRSWSVFMDMSGIPPIARDSHNSFVHGNRMYVFGGSTGSAMNDLHELTLDRDDDDADADADENNHESTAQNDSSRDVIDSFTPMWRAVKCTGHISHRFCHVGAFHGDNLYIFGGYDGSSRLNDFMRFEFCFDDLSYNIPPSTIVPDMRAFVNNEALSDITFIVDGHTVYAHKIMLVRCNYFRAMLTGNMMEASLSTINLEDVSCTIFLSLLEYLYTDRLNIDVENAMELFAAADLFGIPRLQGMCEKKMLQSIEPDNAATIFHAADEHCASLLRSKALTFILKHFEQVSKSAAFEEMARNNVELVVEILRLR